MALKTFKDLEELRVTMESIAQEQLTMAERERTGPKRLVIDIPEEWHKEIKQRALDKNISIKTWVSRAIKLQMGIEGKYE